MDIKPVRFIQLMVVIKKKLIEASFQAFYHAMASTSEFSVSTQILRNQSLASRSYHGDDFKVSFAPNAFLKFE